MRLLNRYIQKELYLPFVFSLLIIIFILFVQFLLRAIDRFLGKGLSVLTILEYLFLNLGWIVALAVPMAVLIAALMTFGRLSEDNEINAMRSSGISFLTIVRPAMIFGVTVALILIYFNNFILPEMNFRARILSGDIYRKRPGLNIDPGHFINDLPDYSMIIRDKENETMKDVRIFSKANQSDSQTSIYAESGELSTLDDATVLTLNNGEIHELDLTDFGNYRRIEFDRHRIVIPTDNLVLNRRDSSNRTDREMTIPMILAKRKSYQLRLENIQSRLSKSFYRVLNDSIPPISLEAALNIIDSTKKTIEQDTSLTLVQQRTQKRKLRTLERQAKNEFNLLESYTKGQNKYEVEIHKKFSLPFACILFVLVGTSLGVLAKKGGFIIGTSLSFGFFLVYYILLIGGEDMADRNIVSPAVGLWTPNVILMIVALYLTLHTVRERPPFQINWPTFRKDKS